jgi:hypothetical protein
MNQPQAPAGVGREVNCPPACGPFNRQRILGRGFRRVNYAMRQGAVIARLARGPVNEELVAHLLVQ